MTPQRARQIAQACADSWYVGAAGINLKEAIFQGIMEACAEQNKDLSAALDDAKMWMDRYSSLFIRVSCGVAPDTTERNIYLSWQREVDETYGKVAQAELCVPRFADVSCSQCGRSFGPGYGGYSHCKDHQP